MRCCLRLLNISNKGHVTNEGVHRKTQAAIGQYDILRILVKIWKLRWIGHILLSSCLAKMIMQDTVQRKKEKIDRRRGGKTVSRSGQKVDFSRTTSVADDRAR